REVPPPCRAVAALFSRPAADPAVRCDTPRPSSGRAGGDPPMFRRLPLRRVFRATTRTPIIPPFTTADTATSERPAGDGGKNHVDAARRTGRTLRYAAAHVAVTALMLSVPAAAFADPSGPV